MCAVRIRGKMPNICIRVGIPAARIPTEYTFHDLVTHSTLSPICLITHLPTAIALHRSYLDAIKRLVTALTAQHNSDM